MKTDRKNGGASDARPAPPKGTRIDNLNDLQRVLCDQIQGVIDGTIPPQNVNAVTNATGKVISIAKMRLEIAKAVGKQFEAEHVTTIHTRKALTEAAR